MGQGQSLVLPAQNLLSVQSRRRGLVGRLGYHWEPVSPLWSHPDPPFPSALTPLPWPLPFPPAHALQMALPSSCLELGTPAASGLSFLKYFFPTPTQDGLVVLPVGLVSWVRRNKVPQARRLNTTENDSESPTSGVGVPGSSHRPRGGSFLPLHPRGLQAPWSVAASLPSLPLWSQGVLFCCLCLPLDSPQGPLHLYILP